ncbi:MAG: hypothetical protein RRY99_07325 [Flavobacterium sp.]
MIKSNTEKIMAVKETKSLEEIRQYFSVLKRSSDNDEGSKTEIKFSTYYELGCMINNMLRLCILGLDNDKDSSINIGLILEHIIELFPLDEFELLDKINQQFAGESSLV